MQTRNLYLLPMMVLAINAAFGDAAAPRNDSHPREVALIEGPAGWKYVHFPSNLRLYVFDRDSIGKSSCYAGCSPEWPPLLANEESKPVGSWTIIVRDDQSKQWAYKGRPVYLRYHDSTVQPSGDGFGGLWHFLEP